MEMLRGIVNRVNRSAAISGSQHKITTGYILTCQIGERAVEITMPRVPVLSDGDEIIVAGETKQGTLVARAYRNVTNGSSGHWKDETVKAILQLVIGLVIVTVLGNVILTFEPTWLIVPVIFFVVVFTECIPKLIASARTRTTYDLVMNGEPQPESHE